MIPIHTLNSTMASTLFLFPSTITPATMILNIHILAFILLASVANAQFGDLFEQLFKQHSGGGGRGGQQPIPEDSNFVEQNYDHSDCKDFLCKDTLKCVSKPVDCPCPFAASQLKCVLPDKKNYVCISAPADPKDEDARDCSFVTKAWKGNV